MQNFWGCLLQSGSIWPSTPWHTSTCFWRLKSDPTSPAPLLPPVDVFIRRDRREAGSQVDVFRRRLRVGHKLLFFPEGTSTDGRRVLPFKTTLFAAFFDPSLRETMSIQPVSVIYRAPRGEDSRQGLRRNEM